MNIVLVHGFLGFREKYGIEYFRGVAEHFRAKSLKVLVPELDQHCRRRALQRRLVRPVEDEQRVRRRSQLQV